MTAGLVGALAFLIAIRERAVNGGSYYINSSLVAANTIALEQEIGLYPLELVQKTAETFQFPPTTPDQIVSEIMIQLIDGWKRGLPHYLGEDSPLMATFEKGPWGRQTVLKQVVKLGDEEATPKWASPAVPNCYYDRGIRWL